MGYTSTAVVDQHEHHHVDTDETDIFGFWLYIMTDCMLFASLFAAFAVLHKNIYGDLGLKDLVSLPYVLGETIFLLVSNLTYGLAMLSSYQDKAKKVSFYLFFTFLLGFGFVYMEVAEFVHLVQEGHTWQSSGALSAFFTLVATHGLHVSFGLLWIVLMFFQVRRYKLTGTIKRRLTYLGLFWNFLDIVWIFVFTIVYLMGVLQ